MWSFFGKQYKRLEGSAEQEMRPINTPVMDYLNCQKVIVLTAAFLNLPEQFYFSLCNPAIEKAILEEWGIGLGKKLPALQLMHHIHEIIDKSDKDLLTATILQLFPVALSLGSVEDLRPKFGDFKELMNALAEPDQQLKDIANYFIQVDANKKNLIKIWPLTLYIVWNSIFVMAGIACLLFFYKTILDDGIHHRSMKEIEAWSNHKELHIGFGSESVACLDIQNEPLNKTWYEFSISRLLTLCNQWNITCQSKPNWAVELPSYMPLKEYCATYGASPEMFDPFYNALLCVGSLMIAGAAICLGTKKQLLLNRYQFFTIPEKQWNDSIHYFKSIVDSRYA